MRLTVELKKKIDNIRNIETDLEIVSQGSLFICRNLCSFLRSRGRYFDTDNA